MNLFGGSVPSDGRRSLLCFPLPDGTSPIVSTTRIADGYAFRVRNLPWHLRKQGVQEFQGRTRLPESLAVPQRTNSGPSAAINCGAVTRLP